MFQNRAEALALALPAAVFAALVFLLPVVVLLSEGFRIDGSWTLSAYTGFFSESLNRTVFLRTFRLGLEVTAVSAVIGYAAASDTPTLVAINRSHLEAWRDFAGDLGTELPPRLDALTSWFAGFRSLAEAAE